MPFSTAVVPAAGTIPWRRRRGTLEVALVHRPKYDDWSWPKGKVDPGEEWAVTAARETLEETGLEVDLGIPLPPASYTVLDRTGQPATKQVRYWAAEVVGGSGRLVNEIDAVAWLDVIEADIRLDYARDRDQLRAVVRADTARSLSTWPLFLVRHTLAVHRKDWKGADDRRRPLDDRGIRQAEGFVPILAAYGVTRLVTSSSERCVKTLKPYAAARGLSMKLKDGLSEEGFEADPTRAVRHLRRLLERGAPSVLSTHGPVLPALVDVLREHVGTGVARTTRLGIDWSEADHALAELDQNPMDKGDVVVCHLVGTGAAARIVAVERLMLTY